MPPHADPDDEHGPEAGVLHKVRSLLAKAESTSFAEEADALTAKAQQLMDRHAIDRAMLAASAPGASSVPEGRRITIEAPYASEKFHLLAEVARVNRSRAVFSAHAGFATVVGFAEDQVTIEVLYTSLLVQATTEMLARGESASTRTRGYRHAFLVAFATRIGHRLQAADDAVVAEADQAHGGAVLPVLASRAVAVDEHLAREFPHLRTRQVMVRDARGWAAGTAAADRAVLAEGAVGSAPRRRGLSSRR